MTVLILMFKSGSKLIAKAQNPIDSLTCNGTLGFLIGDSRAFVESRIRHLGLDTEKDVENKKIRSNFGLKSSILTTATGLFNNIESVSFGFEHGLLSNININIDYIEEDDIGGLLLNKVSEKLGLPQYRDDENVFWKNSAGSVCLYVNEGKYIIGISK